MRAVAWACLLVAVAGAAPGPQAPDRAPAERARVVAALEHLMLTGEPRHVTHDEGQWLQGEVDAAFARNDLALQRLARRAAVPLLVSVSRPMSSTRDLPGLSIQMPAVLRIPTSTTYTAELFASVDGSEPIRVGAFSKRGGDRIDRVLPPPASRPGLHHLHLRAHIVYGDGSGLQPEIRELPDVRYAIYDPDVQAPYSSRALFEAAARINMHALDDRLPPATLGNWLNALLAEHGGRSVRREDWRLAYCDERSIEAGLLPRSPSICAVVGFEIQAITGELWLHAGRLEGAAGDLRWLAEGPTFEGLRLRHSHTVDVEALSVLPDLLAGRPDAWPLGDLSVAPEDIDVTREGSMLSISAVIRNAGTAGVRGAHVLVGVTTTGSDGASREFVVDVPKGGTARVQISLPLVEPYGAALVHAMQSSEHAPHDTWTPDPTPDDSIAFRVIDPHRAPRGYAQHLIAQCGYICRGY